MSGWHQIPQVQPDRREKQMITMQPPDSTASINQIGIDAHAKLADFYRYRPPYLVEFFDELSKRLGLDADGCVLDLCCGQGELATGISSHTGKVHAVDGSPEMLARSARRSNVTYHQSNINLGLLPLKEKFDHFLIGTAIHWIRDYALASIIKSHLKEHGKISVTHRLLDFEDRNLRESLDGLNHEFGKRKAPNRDFSGILQMEACGFIETDRLKVAKNSRLDLNYLYMNQLSNAYGEFQDNVISKPDEYKSEFMRRMSPHASNGLISAKLVNWAVIYGRGDRPRR